MKRQTITLLAVSIIAGGGLCRGQEIELEKDDEWNVNVELVHKVTTFHHDALQKRADQEYDIDEVWRNGATEGDGWGISVTAQKDKGRGVMSFVRCDYDYDRMLEEGWHSITSDRRDFDLMWSQITGTHKDSMWGWNLGFNYLGLNKTIRITEGGDSLTEKGQNYWYMLIAGYFGENWVFGREYFNIHGSVNLMFGEASGLARNGFDDDEDDDDIKEWYNDKYSLAYGMNASVGVGFRLTPRINVGLDYEREWMYSFKGTETGVVIFPDNNDALFIENSHNVYAFIGFAW